MAAHNQGSWLLIILAAVVCCNDKTSTGANDRGSVYCLFCRVLSAVVEGVKWLMAADRKVSALKELQGHIWRHGYENGDLQGQYASKHSSFSTVIILIQSYCLINLLSPHESHHLPLFSTFPAASILTFLLFWRPGMRMVYVYASTHQEVCKLKSYCSVTQKMETCYQSVPLQ